MNQEEIKLAKAKWDDFVKNLSDDGKKELARYSEPVEGLSLYAYFVAKDYVKFDKAINTLSKQYLFEDNIIQMVYSSYVERGLPEVALSYIDQAIEYHQKEALNTNVDFVGLRTKLLDQRLFDNLKHALAHLRNLPPQRVPGILPAILNGQYQFKEFILGEIIAALKLLAKKKKAIRTDKENFINDILVAILTLRFPLWGWEISDQNRSGSSASGKDAGEVDCTIKAAGNDLALIEAFILKGKDTDKITEHITKCFGYIENISSHFIVIYYTGKKENFDTTWNSYKEVVNEIAYPARFLIDKTLGIKSIENLFTDIENMRIAKTKHNSIFIYHMILDLS